jgi:diguanylate cyclase (GGDEF)-like protein
MWAGLGELMDQFAEAMLVVNAKHEVLCWNQAARELLGARLDAITGEELSAASGSVRVFHTQLQALSKAVASHETGFLLLRSDSGVRFVSAACRFLAGLSADALLAGRATLDSCVEPADRQRFAGWFASTEDRPALSVQACYYDGGVRNLRLHARQGAVLGGEERLELIWAELEFDACPRQEETRWLALVGGESFRAELGETVDAWRSGQSDRLFAVAMLDLPRLRAIAQRYGAASAGDLITEAAFRMENVLERGDVIAKLGDSEFGLLLRDLHDRAAGAERMARIIELLNEPFHRESEGVQIILSPRAGLAFPENLQATADTLVRDADAALEQAKRRKQQLCILPTPREVPPAHIIAIEHELSRAIDKDEIYFEFQPIFRVRDRQIVMLEALSRWRHPRLGSVAPTSFIEAAEDSGLVLKLDVRGLERLANQLARWQESGSLSRDILYTINMSGCHFPAFVNEKRIFELLASPPLRGARLAFEVTETAFLEGDSVTVNHFKHLREAGVEIWLDDFGEGHSSLRYLMDFPVDGIKVSEFFVRHALDHPKARAILSSIRSLTKSLGLGLVAEGVETREQWELLGNLGYETVQGYFYSRALPAEAAAAAWRNDAEPNADSSGDLSPH